MTDHKSDGSDPLDDDYRDQLVAIGKGVASLVPVVGGPLAEIIGAAIPNQRADRIAAYVRALGARIDSMDGDVRAALAHNAAKLDLVVEGGYQAARALSTERVERIVKAVSSGLAEDDADVIRRKRLLGFFGELDDDEVAILNAYGRLYGGADRQAMTAISRPCPIHLQSTSAEIESGALYELGREHLIRLDLLRRNYGNMRKHELPEFDARSGQFKHTVEVSQLGRMQLKEIGLRVPFDEDR